MRTVLDGGGIVQDAEGNAKSHWHAPEDTDTADCHWCQRGLPITSDEVINGYRSRRTDA